MSEYKSLQTIHSISIFFFCLFSMQITLYTESHSETGSKHFSDQIDNFVQFSKSKAEKSPGESTVSFPSHFTYYRLYCQHEYSLASVALLL